jgi:hypothetical protein
LDSIAKPPEILGTLSGLEYGWGVTLEEYVMRLQKSHLIQQAPIFTMVVSPRIWPIDMGIDMRI